MAQQSVLAVRTADRAAASINSWRRGDGQRSVVGLNCGGTSVRFQAGTSHFASIHVVKAAWLMTSFLWDMTSCNWVIRSRRFDEKYCIHHQKCSDKHTQ